MLELTIRLVVSLAIVVGLLMVLARVGARRFQGGKGAAVQVLHRQALTRASSVAVVSVGSRVLVLGTTEHQVSLLAELDPTEVEVAQVDGEPAPSEDALRFADALDGALAQAPTPAEGPEAPPAVVVLDLPTRTDPSVAAATRAAYAAESAARPTVARSGRHAAPRSAPARSASGGAAGPLAGSVLSPQTWRDALSAAKGRAS